MKYMKDQKGKVYRHVSDEEASKLASEGWKYVSKFEGREKIGIMGLQRAGRQ